MRLVVRTVGRWEVDLKNRWEVGLVGNGLSKMAGSWPPKQVADRKLVPKNRWEIGV